MRRSILLPALLLVAASASTSVADVSTASTGTRRDSSEWSDSRLLAERGSWSTPVNYTRHLTRIADGTNAPCGPLRMFIVRAHLQKGHRFYDLHAFRIRLRGGETMKVRFEPWNLSGRGRVATWYAREVGDAKVSRRLRLSRTTFTTTPGSRWHASISANCYSL